MTCRLSPQVKKREYGSDPAPFNVGVFSHLARVGGKGQNEPPAREVDEVLPGLAADGGGVGQGGGGGRELEEVPPERGRGLGGAGAGGGNALEMYEKMHVHDKDYYVIISNINI